MCEDAQERLEREILEKVHLEDLVCAAAAWIDEHGTQSPLTQALIRSFNNSVACVRARESRTGNSIAPLYAELSYTNSKGAEVAIGPIHVLPIMSIALDTFALRWGQDAADAVDERPKRIDVLIHLEG